MKFGDVDFCALCLHRGVCPKHKEEPQYKGTMCLAWAGDEAEKASKAEKGEWKYNG